MAARRASSKNVITIAVLGSFAVLAYFQLNTSSPTLLNSPVWNLRENDVILEDTSQRFIYPLHTGQSYLNRTTNSVNVKGSVASYGLDYASHRKLYELFGVKFIEDSRTYFDADSDNVSQWEASVLAVRWDKGYRGSLLELLNSMEKHVTDYMIVLLERDSVSDLPSTSTAKYDFIDFYRYNNTMKTDINSIYSLSEMGLFHFVDLHRRWDLELPLLLHTVNQRYDLTTTLASLFPDRRIYLLKGLPANSFEVQTFKALDEFQYFKGCSDRKSIPFAVFYFKDCGLACHLHWMQYVLTAAFNANYSIEYVAGDNFGYDGPPCIFNDYRCFFLPHPSCGYTHNQDQRSSISFDLPSNGLPLKAPYNNVDQLWWRAVLHHYLFRLNPRLFKMVRDAIADVSASASDGTMFPCTSIHVRRGDKAGEHAPTDLAFYLKALEKFETLRESKGLEKIKKIFLMTDEEKVVTDTKQQLKNYEVLSIDLNRAEIKPITGGYQQGLDVLMEAYMASKCDHFIGTYSSNVGRLIAELMLLRFSTSESMDDVYHYAP